MGKYTGFRYLSHRRVARAQASLRTCADSPEPSLLAYRKYGYRWRLRPIFRHLSSLDTSEWAFIRGVCAYAINTEISCAGLIMIFLCTASLLDYISTGKNVVNIIMMYLYLKLGRNPKSKIISVYVILSLPISFFLSNDMLLSYMVYVN